MRLIRKHKFIFLILLFIGLLFGQHQYYDYQNRISLALKEIYRDEVKHYEEIDSTNKLKVENLDNKVKEQQIKLNTPSSTPAPKLSCPTSTPLAAACLNSDPVVDCKVDEKCGGGTMKLNKSVCDNTVCCTTYSLSLLLFSNEACNTMGQGIQYEKGMSYSAGNVNHY